MSAHRRSSRTRSSSQGPPSRASSSSPTASPRWRGTRRTPLVEPIPGEDQRVVVTFLWRGKPDTKGVLGIIPFRTSRNLLDNMMARLLDTDVWYSAERLRASVRAGRHERLRWPYIIYTVVLTGSATGLQVMLMLKPLAVLVVVGTAAVRLGGGPILTPASSSSLGDNLNGPSLIRVPDWVPRPLGRYYLYFAHHKGSHIRLAYADTLTGPWTVHEPGALALADARGCVDHIASPDVHVESAHSEIRMYFHCSTDPRDAENSQRTFLATSKDGLHFTGAPTPLGPYYFRVFRWGGYDYAIARGGVFLRSRDGRSAFQEGPSLFSRDPRYTLRHAAVDLRGDTLSVYYSRIGDCPERILVSRVQLTPDWATWRASDPEDVLSPDRDYEGGSLPLTPSETSLAPGPVRQLRDPAIYREGSRTYLLYSIAGESGLAIAELR